MPRVSTCTAASESQSQPVSQPQTRSKRGDRVARGRNNEVEDEDSQQEDVDEETVGADGDNEKNGIQRKAIDLVRLALFTEYRRTALRRDEIAKKVFGGHAAKKDLQPIFEHAQYILNKVFGMELHEIMSRAERDRTDAAREGATEQEFDENATGLKRKAATVSSKQYILRSTLDPFLIEAASAWDVGIEEAERAEDAVLYPNERDRRPEGTIIAWRHASADQLGATGILHVILALILVNGRVLTDMQLKSYLRRMRLPTGAAIPSDASSSTLKPLTIDVYLTQLLKQSYLDKRKTSLAAVQGGGQKRGRGGIGGGEDGDASFEWRWGTRAIAEIGEEGVGAFVVDFMDNIDRERESRRVDEEGTRGNGRMENERLKKRKESLKTAIGRAAGGGLVPYK